MHATVVTLRRLGSSLLMGLCIACAVAWACALWSPLTFTSPRDPQVTGRWVDVETFAGVGYSGETDRLAKGAEGEPLNWERFGPSEFRAGWPARMFISRVVPHAVNDHALAGLELPLPELLGRGLPTDRLPALFHAAPGRRIPVQPLWTGLTINVLVWSLAVAGTRRAWSALVRSRRDRQHRCHACGYPRRGLPQMGACPECGHVCDQPTAPPTAPARTPSPSTASPPSPLRPHHP